MASNVTNNFRIFRNFRMFGNDGRLQFLSLKPCCLRLLRKRGFPICRGFRSSSVDLIRSPKIVRITPSPEAVSTDDSSSIDTKGKNLRDLFKQSATFDCYKDRSVDDVWASSAYPVEFKVKPPKEDTTKPRINPEDTSVILFPGQGSQFVGMGKQLLKFPNVQDLYERASDILRYDLLKLCCEGPKLELDRTIHCQAAVVVTSLAALEKLKDERPLAVERCVVTAGFSIGEITALIFSRAMSFEDGIRLVKVRGEAMQAASELNPSGLMTVFLEPATKINYACLLARQWCEKKGITDPVCSVANYLFPQCRVIGGDEEALKFIQINAKDLGIKRYKRLPVSGAFHTDLMRPAMEPFEKALKAIHLEKPLIQVLSNVDAEPYRNIEEIHNKLTKQLYKPVKWEQIMQEIYKRSEENYPRSFECGPGDGLRTMLRNVNAKAHEKSFNVVV